MVLSDQDIIQYIADGSLVIDPYDESNVEPASVDLRLGEDFKRPSWEEERAMRLGEEYDDEFNIKCKNGSINLKQDDFILATTSERVELPDDIVGNVLGRSSLGRIGISVHQTAGYIDPGFEGQITLELSNHGPAPVRLEPGHRICQIVFNELSSPALSPYGHEGSQYQNQIGATESGMKFD